MSVDLEPSELGFRRPFTHEVSQVLRLRNPSSDSLAFKVKTTAPKQYCVRPNSGKIDPGSSVEVQVLLQAMKDDPPLDTRCRDKFLVQSVTIPAGAETGSVQQIWSNVEATAKGSVQEKKIRVTFLPADGQQQTNGVSGAGEDEHAPSYSSPSPAAVTPQRSMGSGAAVGAISTPSDRPSDAKNRGEAVASAYNPETTENQSMMSSVSSAIPTNRDDLQRQLDAANAKVKQLQEQASEGLRQRKVGGDAKSGNTSTGMQNAPAPGGVPIQIAALLCVICFLLAYFFF